MALLGKKIVGVDGTVVYVTPSSRQTVASLSLVNINDRDVSVSVGLVGSKDKAIEAITVSASGSGFETVPLLKVEGKHTSEALAEVKYMTCTGVSVLDGGSGYAIGDVVTVTADTTDTSLRVESTTEGGVVSTVSIITAGHFVELVTKPAAAASTTGAGVNATFDLSYGIGTVLVTYSGNGYSEVDANVTFTSDTGTSATFTLTYFASLENTDLIEWNVVLTPSTVLERTGLALGAGDTIIVKSNTADSVNAIVYGFEDLA